MFSVDFWGHPGTSTGGAAGRGGGGGVIIGGPTAPAGPCPEIEVEKGRSQSNEGKHFRKADKKTDSNKSPG